MMKHWQQIEQEAKDNMARVQRERSEARRSQQSISKYFKAVIRAARRVVSDEKKALGLGAVSERRQTMLEDWQRIRHEALVSIRFIITNLLMHKPCSKLNYIKLN